MAAVIWESEGYAFDAINHFIDGDIDRPNPFLASFKNIDWINMIEAPLEIWVKNMELIAKASVRIQLLVISEEMLEKLCETHKDLLISLNVIKMSLKIIWTQLPKETVEIINEIKPHSAFIFNLEHTFDNFIMFLSLGSQKIKTEFISKLFSNLEIVFLNSKILLSDYDPNQKLYFISESATFKIHEKGLKNINLIKRDGKNSKSVYYLFISFESVSSLYLSKSERVSSINELDEQIKYINDEGLLKNRGFVVPLRYLDQTYIDRNKLFDILKANQHSLNGVFQAREVNLPIIHFDDIMEIKKYFPEHISHINYLFSNSKRETININTEIEIMNDLDLVNTWFSSIIIKQKLLEQEFELIWKILCSRRTRFKISNISIEFNLLSECLNVLSLCSDCPELEFISFSYYESDIESKGEAIDQAIKDFRNKFGYINYLKINQNE